MPLQHFDYQGGQLYCERVPLRTIAKTVGTPVYVYSARAIRGNFRAYKRSLSGVPHEIHYAVKANSSLAVLALLAAGRGRLRHRFGRRTLPSLARRAATLRKSSTPAVGKTRDEVAYALEERIGAFHCESP